MYKDIICSIDISLKDGHFGFVNFSKKNIWKIAWYSLFNKINVLMVPLGEHKFHTRIEFWKVNKK